MIPFAYPGGRVAFLAAAVATHALVGYTLGDRLYDAPLAGLVGGVAPDADFLFPAAWSFPLVHRGITHAALAVFVAAAVATAATDRRTGGAVAAGYAAHVAVDATTPKGVPALYPVDGASYGVVLSGHSPAATALLWTVCLATLALDRVGRRPGST